MRPCGTFRSHTCPSPFPQSMGTTPGFTAANQTQIHPPHPTCACLHMCTCVQIHECTHVCTGHECVHEYAYVRMSVHMCACVCENIQTVSQTTFYTYDHMLSTCIPSSFLHQGKDIHVQKQTSHLTGQSTLSEELRAEGTQRKTGTLCPSRAWGTSANGTSSKPDFLPTSKDHDRKNKREQMTRRRQLPTNHGIW